jgi:UDP-GlcNAc3NAcA epimerase
LHGAQTGQMLAAIEDVIQPEQSDWLPRLDLLLVNRITFIDPVGYFGMIDLESNAALIVMNFGEVQKEAYFHRVTCITLRDETEWLETVQLEQDTATSLDYIFRESNYQGRAIHA